MTANTGVCELRRSHSSRALTSTFFFHPKRTAAMIDRLVHHAEVISLKGDSYRLKGKELGRVPSDNAA